MSNDTVLLYVVLCIKYDIANTILGAMLCLTRHLHRRVEAFGEACRQTLVLYEKAATEGTCEGGDESALKAAWTPSKPRAASRTG